jgi:hypothetical protein
VQVGVWSDLGTLSLPRAVAVHGRVVTPELAPIGGATVFVVAAPPAPAGIDPMLGPAAWPMFACAPVRTDGDGGFSVDAPALAVCVVAVADEREFAGSRTLELARGAPGAPIELCCPPLRPGSRIELHVVDADGRALPGARVCRRTGTAATGDPGAIRQPRWFTADADGRAAIPSRAGIDYDLRVEAPGCAAQVLTMRRAGDDERVRLGPQ